MRLRHCASITVVFFLFFACHQEHKFVTIGAVLPLTGDAAAYGKSAQRGIETAVAEANARRGSTGTPIRVIYEDCQATPRVGVAAITKLITSDKVHAVLGGIPSSVTLAMAPIAEQHHTILLSPTSSAPAITEAGDYIFRIAPSDIYQGRYIADAAYLKLHLRRAAIVYVNNDYGVGLKDTFARQFTSNGGVVTLAEPYDTSATDFRAIVQKLKARTPDCIYLICQKEGGLFLRQLRDVEQTARVLSTVLFEDPSIVREARAAANGVIYTFPLFDPSMRAGRVATFVTSFTKKYGQPPDIFAALSYDATNVLLSAIFQGGDDADGIKRALYATRNFPGVAGPITFDRNGDVTQGIRLKTVRSNAFTNFD